MNGEVAWLAPYADSFAGAMDARRPQEPPHPERLISGALWYAEAGIPVFPLHPGTKIPYQGSSGVNDATLDPELIARWWGWRPDSNVGLACGHRIDVIDFDGPAAHEAWAQRFPDATTWGDCGLYVLATVRTPRTGGLHVYVPSIGRGNRAGLLDHVDYRGLGGYVVAPPSHTNAGRYVFVDRLDPATLDGLV